MSSLSAEQTAPAGRRLGRARDGRGAAPVRMAHLGLGNFFRAHQAWYTEHAADNDEWGIAAFTGRSAGIAADLAEQNGLYTLLVRRADGDRAEVVSSLSQVHSSQRLDAWHTTFARPELAIVTTTVTEAGYRREPSGGLDLADPDVAGDLVSLRAGGTAGTLVTAPGKLVAGLLARRQAGLPGVTLVPCDNLPNNGEMLRRVVIDLAEAISTGDATWIEDNCTFVTTMVDRITPRTTKADRADLLAATGIQDPACVVTEPYTEWVLSGDFVAGKPAWEGAGARFVDDLERWEKRKLWLLNGSHSLMAYAAPLKGAQTVAEAIADPIVRGWVEQWWDDAEQVLPLPAEEIAAYREALIERYSNPRIRHLLSQIAADGRQKVPIRIVPVLRAHRARGDLPLGATRAIAAWTLHLRGLGSPVSDAGVAPLVEKVTVASLAEAVTLVLATLQLDDATVSAAVLSQAQELAGLVDS